MRARVKSGLFVLANLVGVFVFAWPFIVPAVASHIDAPWILGVLMLCLGVLLFAELDRGGLGPKTVALIAVLGGAMVALRLPGYVAGFSAMFIVVLVAGNSFGPGFGFLLGAVGTFASALFVGGLGPWLPFQMVAVGWVGAGAGVLPRPSAWPLRIGILAAYGFVSAFLFGAVINLYFWPFLAGSSRLGWDAAAGGFENLRHYAAFYAVTSLGWDAAGGIGNAVFVVLLARPLLGAFDRAARRMNLEINASAPGGGLRRMRVGAGRTAAVERVRDVSIEESPDSAGQDAGESPRRGDPWQVQQRADRPG
jgi:energy-coupling factor transport system substrate-specific component